MSDEKIDLDTLRRIQVELIDEAMSLLGEKNGEKLLLRAKALQRKGADLAAKAKVFEIQQTINAPKPVQGSLTVKLTDEQRQRIGAETGIDMPELVLEDVGVSRSMMMEHSLPPMIEAEALRKAQAIKVDKEAKMKAKGEMRKALALLESQNNADLKKLLAEARKNPDFLGGFLKDD